MTIEQFLILMAFVLPPLLVRLLPTKPKASPLPEPPPPPREINITLPPYVPPPRESYRDWSRRMNRQIYGETAYDRRRARMQANGGKHTAAEWAALCALFNHRCAKCKRKRPLTKDHIVPVVNGGSDDITNIQPLCQSCNSSKGPHTRDYRKGRTL